ncbi:S-locus glycoprotein domain containing protein [Parasponia andersonii]|uniref:S-locus glycoprotein domain containing protein n=1 Tax=Parasponia andersonii TaxID=3476 RepID=A0A2P5BW51_PARAD|nr:S-locus glycoprotein domain containing protein [Parasponia andersonii]
MDIRWLPQLLIFMGSTKNIRIGPWNGADLSGLNVVSSYSVLKPVLIFNETEAYFMFEPNLDSVVSWITVNSAGHAQLLTLQNGSNQWGVRYHFHLINVTIMDTAAVARGRPLECHKGEGFIKREVKLPDLLEFWLNKDMSLEECKEGCLKNCSCTAYANSDITNGGSGCLMRFGDIIDLREHRIKVRTQQDVYIRMSALDMSK